MGRNELWSSVHNRDARYRAKKDSGVKDNDRSPSYHIQLRVLGEQGKAVEYIDGEVIAALVATEEILKTVHSRHGKRMVRTSRLVPDGFKVNTLGGTVVFNMSGRGETCWSDHEGNRLGNTVLQMDSSPRVRVEIVGELTLDRVSDDDLAWALRDAARNSPELRSQIEGFLNARRSYLD
jgi:hypothetical protein